ncbi:MAG: ATP-dependent RecD-like DNA helicase [Clostridium sp.]|nr:ATP-dependent RecD-like DNA helicase [Clostridium sp.]
MEVLDGFVDGIVYKNEENGYTVAKINIKTQIVVAVGNFPYIKEGEHLKLTGNWIVHKQFGKQFSVTNCEEILPTTIEGIEKYLTSGIIKGIGPVTARRIVNYFGEKSLEILDNDIDRLKEIEGIGKKKFEIIKQSYFEHYDLRNIIMYLQEFGLTQGQCMKIYRTLGKESINKIKQDPYMLCRDIKGIGFSIADKIANQIGIDKNSESRIKSGIDFVISRFCGYGNTFMPMEDVLAETKSLLLVDEEEIASSIYSLVIEKNLYVNKINDKEAVFLPLYYHSEVGIRDKIAMLSMKIINMLNIDVDFEINNFERKNNITFATSQREAIKNAFCEGIEIITGGPGTGKTTIIKAIIDIYENQGMKVLMAAPTGRAAKRITESTGREAKTIHRLLQITAGEEDGVFETLDDDVLDGDVIIIDEASMIDIFLMNNLLSAMKVGMRLILVGDADQLPSVGAGNVLKDLINSKFIKVVKLKEIFRQGLESLITMNAHRINNGEMPFLNQKGKDFYFIQQEGNENIANVILDLVNRRLPNFNSNWSKTADIQVLSSMKRGILGIENLNIRLQEVLNPKSKYKKERKVKNYIFREGDKVMQTKNNYSVKWLSDKVNCITEGEGVFNGDMGFIQKIDEEEDTLTVVFEDKRVIYSRENMDELELAYAITIHKSQGSEFKVVVIPCFMGSPFLMSRNLIYTGITRAKELVVVVGYPKALKYMVENNYIQERYSSLEYRLKELTEID